MTHEALNAMIRARMPDHLCITVVPATPLYRQLEGDAISYKPYVVEIIGGYATSAYDNHDTYLTRDEALQAGLRLIARRGK